MSQSSVRLNAQLGIALLALIEAESGPLADMSAHEIRVAVRHIDFIRQAVGELRSRLQLGLPDNSLREGD